MVHKHEQLASHRSVGVSPGLGAIAVALAKFLLCSKVENK